MSFQTQCLKPVLALTLRLYSVTVHADEEVKKKFKDDVEPISKSCAELHPLKEGNQSVYISYVYVNYKSMMISFIFLVSMRACGTNGGEEERV
jgi:hypothetical protein